MSYRERRKIIEKIEKIRDTKVITYIVSTRPNIDTDIDAEDLRIFYDHLSDEIFAGKDIDLFIYIYGGDTARARALPNLIRSIGKQFSVLIASYAFFSCATSIALGADEIVMTKMGLKREEAREIGLKVKNAEDISPYFSQLMWDLFLDYENEMKLLIPYLYELPEKDFTAKIILKKIESTVTESTNINEQKWFHLDLPEGCLPTKDPDTDRECIFRPPDQRLYLNLPGKLVLWENKIYNIRENIYWKSR